jgi:energy-coupling factor transport system permease protein
MTLNRWPGLAVALGLLIAVTLGLRLGRAWLGLLNGLGFAAVSFFVIAWLAFDLPTALVAGLRLLTIGTVFFLFFQTTAPEDLANALVKLGTPYAFAFVLTASMQFVPVLARRAANIRDAQRARGIPLDGGLVAIRHLPALVGPLLIQAFKLADELAEAMEARGFGAPGRRFRREPQFGLTDWSVVAVSVAVLVVVVWVSRG